MCVCARPKDVTILMTKELLFLMHVSPTMSHCFLGSDWCISRQLWWGHQIPAYQVELPDSRTNTEEVSSVHTLMFKMCASGVKKKILTEVRYDLNAGF